MQTMERRTIPRSARRLGYALAIGINLALLVVVWNIPDSGVIPFISDEFRLVIPWLVASLLVSIGANTVYLAEDRLEVKATGEILVSLTGVIVAYRIWQVFPFDFGTSGFDWSLVVRVLLGAAMVGGVIGVVAQASRLASRRAPSAKEVSDDGGV